LSNQFLILIWVNLCFSMMIQRERYRDKIGLLDYQKGASIPMKISSKLIAGLVGIMSMLAANSSSAFDGLAGVSAASPPAGYVRELAQIKFPPTLSVISAKGQRIGRNILRISGMIRNGGDEPSKPADLAITRRPPAPKSLARWKGKVPATPAKGTSAIVVDYRMPPAMVARYRRQIPALQLCVLNRQTVKTQWRCHKID
jgi:hypothetical protein